MPSSDYSVAERRNENEGEVIYESGGGFVCFVGFFLISSECKTTNNKQANSVGFLS